MLQAVARPTAHNAYTALTVLALFGNQGVVGFPEGAWEAGVAPPCVRQVQLQKSCV